MKDSWIEYYTRNGRFYVYGSKTGKLFELFYNTKTQVWEPLPMNSLVDRILDDPDFEQVDESAVPALLPDEYR